LSYVKKTTRGVKLTPPPAGIGLKKTRILENYVYRKPRLQILGKRKPDFRFLGLQKIKVTDF